MSVYVDPPVEYEHEVKGYVGRTRERVLWCHMIADTPAELHAMAADIGLRREWAQTSQRGDLHYDLVPTKRAIAIKFGAVQLKRFDFGRKLRELRAKAEAKQGEAPARG